MPTISVMFPVFNPDLAQLKKSIDSIINQTFGDFELIIYDDGSKNDVKHVVDEYAKADSRIRFIRDEHHGLTCSLNKMVELSQGRYLARMDADDISATDRFEKEYLFLEKNPEYGFVSGNILLIDDNDVVYGCRKYPEKPKKKDFLKFQPYVHPAIMFRKSILDMDKPYGADEKDRRGEDYELLMSLTAAGINGFNLQDDLLFYRETKDSYKRRKLRYQIAEIGIRYKGFKKLGLNPWKEIYYVFKPIIVWLVPNRIAFLIRKRALETGV